MDDLDSPAELTMAPGDCLVLLSDGFIEAETPAGEMFGVDRVTEIIRGHRGDLESLATLLIGEVERYTQGQQADDMTAVLIRRRP